MKLQRRYSTDDIAALTHERDVAVAIVYGNCFAGGGMDGVPPEWTRVGQWKLSNNVVAGGDVISIYSATLVSAPELAEHLRDFSASLHGDVGRSGAFVR